MTNSAHTQEPAPPTSGPIRTLVVDDSPKWLKPICEFLARDGAVSVVGTARDGLEALGQVRALDPALVLLDVRMPRMSGLEAAALIRDRYPQVRILMMSVNDDAWTREACSAHGAHAFVLKSDTARELLPAIRQIFGADGATADSQSENNKTPNTKEPEI